MFEKLIESIWIYLVAEALERDDRVGLSRILEAGGDFSLDPVIVRIIVYKPQLVYFQTLIGAGFKLSSLSEQTVLYIIYRCSTVVVRYLIEHQLVLSKAVVEALVRRLQVYKNTEDYKYDIVTNIIQNNNLDVLTKIRTEVPPNCKILSPTMLLI